MYSKSIAKVCRGIAFPLLFMKSGIQAQLNVLNEGSV